MTNKKPLNRSLWPELGSVYSHRCEVLMRCCGYVCYHCVYIPVWQLISFSARGKAAWSKLHYTSVTHTHMKMPSFSSMIHVCSCCYRRWCNSISVSSRIQLQSCYSLIIPGGETQDTHVVGCKPWTHFAVCDAGITIFATAFEMLRVQMDEG